MTPKVLAIESPVQPPAAQVPASGQHPLAPLRVRSLRRRCAASTPETAPGATPPPAPPVDQPHTVSAGCAAGCLVRRLGPGDAAPFQALRLEGLARHPCAFAASPDEEAGHSLAEVAGRLEREPVFGAFDGAELVGIAAFAVPSVTKKRHKGVLRGVYVRDAARGRGLGRALVLAVIEHARAHVVQLHATVVTTNHPALRLYRSLGFSTYGLEPRGLACAGQYFDQELMVLMLHREG
jgi:ribosomal protein S18 acetylase RimI-like enzyme